MYISLLPPLESSHDPSDLSCDPNQKDGNHYSVTAWLLLIKEYFYNVVLVIFHTLIIYFGCKTLDLQK